MDLKNDATPEWEQMQLSAQTVPKDLQQKFKASIINTWACRRLTEYHVVGS